MQGKYIDYLLKNQVILALVIIGVALLFSKLSLIFIIFFFAFVIMSGFSPFVDYFLAKRFPKFLAVIIPYLPVIAGLLLVIIFVLPDIFNQFQTLLGDIPNILDSVASNTVLSVDTRAFFSDISGNLVSYLGPTINFIFAIFAIFIVSIYMLLSRAWLYDMFVRIFGIKNKDETIARTKAVEERLGHWLRGQLAISGLVGLLTYIFLTILQFPYSISLAVLAGVLELIPYAGPVLAAIPAIVVALNLSVTDAALVTGGYVAIQQVENNILQPTIMRRAVNLHPLVTIAVVIGGAELWGIWGALVAVPVAATVKAIYTPLDEKQ